MATEVLHHHHNPHHRQSTSGPPGAGANPHQSEPHQRSPVPPQRHHNDNAPPSPFHPHSPNENNVEHHHDHNAQHNGSGPTAADFNASDGNNDLDEPRMVTNRDGTVEDWNHITKPGGNDVLLGRGGGTNNHSGNIKFRQLVNEHKMAYLACSKVDKPKVAREVVAIWRKMSPAGRFLARKDETKRGPGSVKANDNVWYEVGDKKAREKASQCLRERTPDVLPYIKHLRDQQNAVTEYGILQMQHQGQPSPGGGVGYGGGGAGGYPPAHHPHHYPCHIVPQPEYHAPSHHPHHMAAQRRNSAPQPLPHLHPHAPQSSSSGYGGGGGGRRASTNSIYEDEYQQQMILMHQTMMQQQHNPYMQQQHPHVQHLPQHNGYEQQQQQQPQGPPHLQPSHSEDTTTAADEADNDAAVGITTNNTNSKKRVSPDRAISLMSLTPMDNSALHHANHHGINDHDLQHELSLEDYRQQLEEYIANCQAEDGGAGNGGRHGATAADDADGNHSDMEDDWERERERAMQQQKSSLKQQQSQRGVGRNVSGLSCFSNKSAGHMSLVSGLSNFDARDTKMSMARSVCSNLSLMSELTDLSQNIDNLSIYDD